MESLYCLGAAGTFSHTAASTLKRDGEVLKYANHLVGVIDKVVSEDAQGIVPIENSTTGLIRPVLDAIAKRQLVITDSYSLKVAHHLVYKKGEGMASLSDITCIYAQREAYDQCNGILGPLTNQVILTHSTHLALGSLQYHPAGTALALVNDQQLEHSDLEVFQKNIENAVDNQTRFVRIQKGCCHDLKAGVMLVGFSLDHRVGALAGALNFLANYGVNLQAIHSRPIENRLGHYRFYVEIGIANSKMADDLNRGYGRYLKDFKILGHLSPLNS